MSQDYTEILDKLAEQITENERLEKNNRFLKKASENLVIHNKELQTENTQLKRSIEYFEQLLIEKGIIQKT